MEKETSHGLKLFKEFLQSKSKERYLRYSSPWTAVHKHFVLLICFCSLLCSLVIYCFCHSNIFLPTTVLIISYIYCKYQLNYKDTEPKNGYSPFPCKRRRHMSICPKRPQCKICLLRNTQSQNLLRLFDSLLIFKLTCKESHILPLTNPNIQPERLIYFWIKCYPLETKSYYYYYY